MIGTSGFSIFIFEQIMRDPIAVIAQMYAHSGFDFPVAAKNAMQRPLDNRPREKHGKHGRTRQQFGLGSRTRRIAICRLLPSFCS
jgi:hypothetical protein